MSMIKDFNFYEFFEQVNIGRRKFVVQEDHTSKIPFSRRILIGFGGLLLVTVLLLGIILHVSGVFESGVGELPYLSSFYSVLGQERYVVEKTMRSAGAQVTYDPAIKDYRLKEPVEFAGHQFDVVLSYDGDNRLSSVMYTLPSYDDAGMMASIACQLMENTQDVWGFSRGSIFNRRYVEWDYDDLKKAFASTDSWQQEITWIVDKDISDLGFEKGNCISVRFWVNCPGNGEEEQIGFTVGLDTVDAGDFVYDPLI